MKKIFVAFIISIITSLYIFPFNTVSLPSVNTKMAMAALALPLFIFKGAEQRNASLNNSMFGISICGLIVSMIGFASVVINNTHDYSYTSYFVSMWVWLGGAYVVIRAIKLAYGKVTFRLIGNFLILVAVIQCFISQLINANETVANLVGRFMVSTGFMGIVEGRLYGLGCALDVAGIKFCAILIITAFFAVSPISKRPNLERYIYILAFLIISVFGAMIARTTTIGIILSIFLWIFLYFKYKFIGAFQKQENLVKVVKTLSIYIILLLPVVIYLYNTNELFFTNLRFGFEGFFSLVEEGAWNVKSNKMLVSQIVWPDNFKTWLIGDGYFEFPMNDYYYTGPAYYYYMGTDVGISLLWLSLLDFTIK